MHKNNIKTKYRYKKSNKNKKTKKYKKKQIGGKLCPKNTDKNDIYTLGKHFMSATNEIYESADNPNILIKKIQKPVVDAEFNNFNIENIKKEFELAYFCSDIKLSPHVYYTTLCIDDDNIIGYLVMDKIKGKIIHDKEELDKHFDKIYNIFNILLTSGIRYNDYNINNFIVENGTNNVYIIDFEDATKVALDESTNVSGLSLGVTKSQIKDMLAESIAVKQMYKTNV